MAPYIATTGIHETDLHTSSNGKSNHPERFWVDYIIEASSNDHARVSLCKALKCRYIIFAITFCSLHLFLSHTTTTHTQKLLYISCAHLMIKITDTCE